MFKVAETLVHGRAFMDHPLAIAGDRRLLTACEILIARLPLQEPGQLRSADLHNVVQAITRHVCSLELYWHNYLANMGYGSKHPLRAMGESRENEHADQ